MRTEYDHPIEYESLVYMKNFPVFRIPHSHHIEESFRADFLVITETNGVTHYFNPSDVLKMQTRATRYEKRVKRTWF